MAPASAPAAAPTAGAADATDGPLDAAGRIRRRCLGRLLAGAAAASPALALAALAAPSGPVMLSFSGRLRERNQGETAGFDLAMLERLEQREYSTRTPWYPTPRLFTGPLLRQLLAEVGAEGQRLRARALNDYVVDIPVEDALRHDVLVARLVDGKPVSVREKGPLMIMYPFDQKPELRSTLYYTRCAWQLVGIEVA